VEGRTTVHGLGVSYIDHFGKLGSAIEVQVRMQ
jgi:hypothetical protein